MFTLPWKRNLKTDKALPVLPEKKLELREQTLLAFEPDGTHYAGRLDSDSGQYEITFADGTRNVIVFGGTGSGKTTSVMTGAVERLVDSGCSGIILDVKGDYTAFLSSQFADRLHVIGPGNNAHATNLIAGMSLDTLDAIFAESIDASVENSYWGMNGRAYARFVFDFITLSQNRNPSLAEIYHYLVFPNRFCRDLVKWEARSEASDHFIESRDSLLMEQFSILHRGNYLKNGSDDPVDSRVLEQYTWQTATIVETLAPFYRNEQVKAMLCDGDASDWRRLLYEDRKVLLLDMPSTRFGRTSSFVSKLLRLAVRNTIFEYAEQYRETNGLGKDFFTFMLVDEYQNYVHANNGSNASGASDDNTWFDRSRSFGHINILSTQGIASLSAQVDRNQTMSMLQNIRTTIILPTQDRETLDFATELSGDSMVCSRLLHPERYGQGFLYCGVSDRQHGGSLCGEIRAGTNIRYPFMSRHVTANYGLPNVARFFWRPDQPVISQPNPSTPRIIVLSPRLSLAREDFQYVLARSDLSEEVLSGISYLPVMDAKSWFEWVNESMVATSEYSEEPYILVWIRGGGDPEALDVFNARSMCQYAASVLEEGNFLITGLGHAADRFALDRHVTKAATTPTEAAYELLRFLSAPIRKKFSNRQPQLPSPRAKVDPVAARRVVERIREAQRRKAETA